MPENVSMCTPEIRVKNGLFTAPEGPGLGVEIVEEAFSAYSKIKVGCARSEINIHFLIWNTDHFETLN